MAFLKLNKNRKSISGGNKMRKSVLIAIFFLFFISAINFLYAQAQPASRGGGSISGVLILIIIIGLIIFLFSKKLKKKHVDVVEGKKKELTEQGYKIGGIINTVIGGAIGVWVFTRLTSLAGKLHSWEPPFTEYETITIIGGGIAVIFIIAGLIYLTKKREQQSDHMERDFKKSSVWIILSIGGFIAGYGVLKLYGGSMPIRIILLGIAILLIGFGINSSLAKKKQEHSHIGKIEKTKIPEETEKEKEAIAKREAELDKKRREKREDDLLKY